MQSPSNDESAYSTKHALRADLRAPPIVPRHRGSNDNGRIGSGALGHLGDQPGEMGDALPTVQLGSGMAAARICEHAFDSEHTCVLLQACPDAEPGCSKVKCWGSSGGLGYDGNPAGMIGDANGEMGDALPFVDVGAVVVDAPGSLVCGFQFHTCVRVEGGHVRCWGDGDKGQIGGGTTASRGKSLSDLPMPPPNVDLGAGLQVAWLSPGPYHTCAGLTDSRVKCWGYNYYGEVGQYPGIQGGTHYVGDRAGEMGTSLDFLNYGSATPAANVMAAGYYSVCAGLTESGASNVAVSCWGHNHQGSLGASSPSQIFGGPTAGVKQGWSGLSVRSLASYQYGYCALLSDDSFRCWGDPSGGVNGLPANCCA